MKNKIFLDTNVVLDLLGEREPFYDSIAKVVTLADKGIIKIIVSTLSYSTVFYLLSKFEKSEIVKEKIRKFKIICESSDLTDKIIDKGLSSNFSDFEDSLQYHCALNADSDIIITRNVKDFKESEIPVMTADEYLKSLQSK
ncbi:MAG: PIN domain-containing protein [Calditrichaceae bacterium]|nr:PIN domain-containing protein [Calditrichaceae bacterium]MBN2709418.1 PIN domain-containing protein [Calditrichaceae bacterium]RQV97423.1 MAG: PIN domain-containing protein [Calditrichota bacterium]